MFPNPLLWLLSCHSILNFNVDVWELLETKGQFRSEREFLCSSIVMTYIITMVTMEFTGLTVCGGACKNCSLGASVFTSNQQTTKMAITAMDAPYQWISVINKEWYTADLAICGACHTKTVCGQNYLLYFMWFYVQTKQRVNYI